MFLHFTPIIQGELVSIVVFLLPFILLLLFLFPAVCLSFLPLSFKCSLNTLSIQHLNIHYFDCTENNTSFPLIYFSAYNRYMNSCVHQFPSSALSCHLSAGKCSPDNVAMAWRSSYPPSVSLQMGWIIRASCLSCLVIERVLYPLAWITTASGA